MREMYEIVYCVWNYRKWRERSFENRVYSRRRYQRYTARGQAFVLTPELSSFRLLIDEPSFLVPWIWVGIHLFFPSLSLRRLPLGFLSTPTPCSHAMAYEANSDTGPLVISWQVFPARRIVRYLMKVWWRKQKLRNYVVLFGGAVFPRNEVTRLCKKSFASANNLFVQQKTQQSFCHGINRR